jgi:hypothetical protein
MANASTRGRPRGPAEATMAKARQILAAYERQGSSSDAVNAISLAEDASTSWVWRMIALARGAPTAVSPDGEVSDVEDSPKPRPRMSQRMILHRAWIAMRLINVFRLLGDAIALFWLNTALEIHELGDGDGLSFGEPGDAYRSRREFAEAAGRTEAELDDLVHRGLLAEVEGGGIDLPWRFGLRPREPAGGNLVAGPIGAAPRRGPRREPDARQGNLPPMGMPSARAPADSTNIQNSDSTNIRSDSTENSRNFTAILVADSTNIPGSRASAASAAVAFDSSSISSSNSLLDPRAGDSTKNAGPDSSLIRPDSSEIPADTGAEATGVAIRLLTAAKIERAPSPKEIGVVRQWRTRGIPEPLILAVIAGTLGRQTGVVRPTSLLYFTKGIDEAWAEASRGGPAPPAPVTPAAPVSAEDQALRALIKASNDAWASDKACPFPPSLASFKVAIAAGLGALAHRWAEYWAAWDTAGRPGRAKPPDFTVLGTRPVEFEGDLERAEEELTAPEAG